MTAIVGKINDGRIQRLLDRRDSDPDSLTEWDVQTLAWHAEIDAQNERKFAYNIPVQRGNILEPDARAYYESLMGVAVNQVGFEAD